MKKIKIILILGLFVASSYSVANAAEPQWYWVSIPNGPETGYFIEGQRTVGQTTDTRAVRGKTSAGYPTITAVYTPVPDNFMEVMEETEDFKKCSGKLDEALDKLRDFDSENKILYEIKSSVEIDEDSYDDREKLLERILKDTEECIEQGENELREEEDEEEKLAQERNHKKEIEKAIKECNLKFFEEEMTSKERRETYKERTACKEGKIPALQTPVNRADLLKQIQSLLELIVQLKAQLASKQGV